MFVQSCKYFLQDIFVYVFYQPRREPINEVVRLCVSLVKIETLLETLNIKYFPSKHYLFF